eukprot:scaffold8191_cov67-Phaeocystis_antarctica.AAC.4
MKGPRRWNRPSLVRSGFRAPCPAASQPRPQTPRQESRPACRPVRQRARAMLPRQNTRTRTQTPQKLLELVFWTEMLLSFLWTTISRCLVYWNGPNLAPKLLPGLARKCGQPSPGVFLYLGLLALLEAYDARPRRARSAVMAMQELPPGGYLQRTMLDGNSTGCNKRCSLARAAQN